jgi:peptidoglycan/LPS O-acetylase OafA/YrhL
LKLQSLTILRAIAATAVVYFHTVTRKGDAFGEFGVDIFFVLSGFVIALVVGGDRKVSVREFAIGRFARVVPLYWLLTLSVFAAAAVAPTLFNSTTADFGNLIKSLLFIPYMKENGLLQPVLYVGWSLNHEMMFYAATALAIVVSARSRMLIASLAVVAIVFLSQLGAGSSDVAAFHANTRSLEFLLGVLAWEVWKRGFRIPTLPALMTAATMLVAMAYMESAKLGILPLVRNGIPSFLLILSVLSLEPLVRNGPVWRLAILLGEASFATYLSHPYVVEALRKMLPKMIPGLTVTSPVGIVCSITAASALGVAIYLLIDRRLHQVTKRLLSRRATELDASPQISVR